MYFSKLQKNQLLICLKEFKDFMFMQTLRNEKVLVIVSFTYKNEMAASMRPPLRLFLIV